MNEFEAFINRELTEKEYQKVERLGCGCLTVALILFLIFVRLVFF